MGVLILRSSPPAGSAPVNSVAPVLSGTAKVGSTLSCTSGTWANSPTGYTYQWKRVGGGSISGATSGTYTAQEADEGESLYCTVTATNAYGSASADSNASASIAPPSDDYLYDTIFSGVATGTYGDQTLTIDGLPWYVWTDEDGSVQVASAVDTYSGKEFRFNFSSASSDVHLGLVSDQLPGIGRKFHVAIHLKYTGYSSLGGIKKTFRFLSNDNDTIIATLNAQSNGWRLYLNEGGNGGDIHRQPDETEAVTGPDTFIGERRWLELGLDFDAKTYGVWVDGIPVMQGTDSGMNLTSGWTLGGTYVGTTFNNPAANGTDHIDRIIFHDSFIGVPD